MGLVVACRKATRRPMPWMLAQTREQKGGRGTCAIGGSAGGPCRLNFLPVFSAQNADWRSGV
jgi:hypothetical protein